MEIKNVRIEERLIHGQVVTVWLSHLKPTRIIIIDNATSANELQKQALRMACPKGTKLSIFSVDRAIERLAEDPYPTESVTHEEAEIFRELAAKGIAIEAKMVPNDPDVDFLDLIKNL